MITNNQEKGWDASASTFEAKFGQALKVMNTQNTLAGLGSTENFVAELQRHMKIVKTCDNKNLTDCFTPEISSTEAVVDVADESTWVEGYTKPTLTNTLTTAKNLGQKDWGTDTMGLQFANGVSAIVAYNPKCSSDPFNNDAVKVAGGKNSVRFDTDCVAMVYDVQAFKKPNEFAKDIRTSSGTVIGDKCIFKISGRCVATAPFAPAPINTVSDCEKVKNTLGINGCGTVPDYWGGGVLRCGHVDKMASATEIAQLASYLYDKPVGEWGDLKVPWKPERLKKLGFDSNNAIYLWTNKEYLDTGWKAYYRDLGPTSTTASLDWGHRNTSARVVICLED